MYGFDVSRLLWFKVRPKLSAGRVQSVAVRLIVDRERERMAFHSATYADLVGEFSPLSGSRFQAWLASYQGRRIPAGKDFDPATGRLKDASLLWMNQAEAQQLAEQRRGELPGLGGGSQAIHGKTQTALHDQHAATGGQPETRLHRSAHDAVAQFLYENGYITYMRTDSTTLSGEAVKAARDLVRQEYGQDFLYETERVSHHQSQERSGGPRGDPPGRQRLSAAPEPGGQLSDEQFKLFDMIWKRTIACQMKDARKRR